MQCVSDQSVRWWRCDRLLYVGTELWHVVVVFAGMGDNALIMVILNRDCLFKIAMIGIDTAIGKLSLYYYSRAENRKAISPHSQGA